MTVLSLASLLIKQTKTEIYNFALGIATAIGLPVTSWQAGDPTRSLYHLESEELSTWEDLIIGFIASGFLDYAPDTWLEIIAKQVFNVDVPTATFATTDVLLTNGGGGFYPDIAAGDLTFKSSISGKTYRNTTGGVLASGPGTTLTVTVVADEAGSDSSAGAEEIDELVTTLLGVTCANQLAAVGLDKQDRSITIAQCRAKLDALSPNGPKGAYFYVALNPALTGTSGVTDSRVYPDSDIGEVTVYLRGPSGAVSSPDLAAAEAAILQWATPLCITPTVLSASNVTVAVAYDLWVYKSVNKTSAQIQAEVEAALEQMFARRPIGGDIIPPATTGSLYTSMITSTIRSLYSQAFRVELGGDGTDTPLTLGQVPALGTVTGTIHFVADP